LTFNLENSTNDETSCVEFLLCSSCRARIIVIKIGCDFFSISTYGTSKKAEEISQGFDEIDIY